MKAGLDPQRAAEVIVTRAEGAKERGSGYLMAGGLVLTCAHVVTDVANVQVRFNADQRGEWSAAAELAWLDPGIDLALLRITASTVIPQAARVPAVARVKFGRVVRPPVPCEAVGYPLFKLREDPMRPTAHGSPSQYRDSHHATGTATTWSNRREGMLEVSVRAPERDPEQERSPWEGMSGAAVFSGKYLIGVIGKHYRTDGLHTLAAYRVDNWYERLTIDRLSELVALIGLPFRADRLTPIISLEHRSTDGALHQLPMTTTAFTGRGRELAELLTHADRAQAGTSTRTVVISAIGGMAGIGKTELAVHAAHELAERFPDGQLFVDLHGYTQGLTPREPAAVLAAFLQAFGVPPKEIPDDLDARAALYRNHLAGTQTLILLDNAATETQIRPLLPGEGGCLVLITSRRRLKALDDAHILALDVLPEPDAVELFRQVAGTDRIPSDAPALADVITLCGCLPLALRIAAALLRHRLAWTLQHLADKLREYHSSLVGFSDGDRDLTGVFDLSFEALGDTQQILFRRLGMVPGPDFDAYVAAALLNVEATDTEGLLQTLVDHNLLVELTQGRYRLHDLIRVYARARAERDEPTAEREKATDRLLDYYQCTAQQADLYVARLAPVYVPSVTQPPRCTPDLSTRERAETWMSAELANLVAATRFARGRARLDHVVALPAAMASYLQSHGLWAQALDLHALAATTASVVGDRRGQAASLDNLGTIRFATGDYPAAGDAHRQALDLYRVLGDQFGEAHALNNLGVALRENADYPGAAQAHEQALDLYRMVGDRQGQANALAQLASLRWRTSDYSGAALMYEQVLEVFRALGDQFGEAHALNNLGVVWRQLGDHSGAAQVLHGALDLYSSLGDRQGQANALNNLGTTARETGDFADAVQALERALDLYRSLGDRQGEADALGNLGIVLRLIGNYPDAAQATRQALERFREIGDLFGEAEAHNESAEISAKIGDPDQEHFHRTEALRLGREIGVPIIEAEALEGLGRFYLRQGQGTDGIVSLQQALEIYERTGSYDAERVATLLATLRSESAPEGCKS